MTSLKNHWGHVTGMVLLVLMGMPAWAGTPTETAMPMQASSSLPTRDQTLAATVLETLRKTPELENEEITVNANNGVITLGGWTQHPDQESRARAVASRVPGVSRAYSRIHLWSTSN